jgi:hypothetical protein
MQRMILAERLAPSGCTLRWRAAKPYGMAIGTRQTGHSGCTGNDGTARRLWEVQIT